MIIVIVFFVFQILLFLSFAAAGVITAKALRWMVQEALNEVEEAKILYNAYLLFAASLTIAGYCFFLIQSMKDFFHQLRYLRLEQPK